MELTLENLITFIKENRIEDSEVLPINKIRKDFYIEIDGDEAIDLLLNLEKQFNVSFENFDFRKHFLEERELRVLFSIKDLFMPPKTREIKQELTIKELYEFMLQNKK